jgi:hypothetical protein
MKPQAEREIPNSPESATVDRFAKVLPSRRRLITGGLMAAPILASLESRNALAVACLTPSGNLSGNVSTGAQAGTCIGISAKAWDDAAAGSWPGGSGTQSVVFHSIFAMGSNAAFGTDTLKAVLHRYSSSIVAQSLGAYIVAAYLNVLSNWVNIPGFDQTALINLLKGMWGDYAINGAYKVNSAVSWSAADIKTYLTSNGIVALSP